MDKLLLLENIKKNRAFTILFINFLLVVAVLFVKDPFHLFLTTYENSKPFFSIQKNEIKSIRITLNNGQQSFQIIRNANDTWNIQQNQLLVDGDIEKITNLIDGLLSAKKFTKLESKKEKLSEFGFEEDSISVEIFDSKNKSYGNLILGSVAPKGSYTHVKLSNSNDIYLVEDNLKSKVGRGEEDFFFNRKLFSNGVLEDEFLEFQFSFPNNPSRNISFKKEKDNWTLFGQAGKFNTTEIKNLVHTLFNFTAISLDKELKTEKKLAKEEELILIVQTKKAKSELTLLGKTKDDNGWIAKLSSNPNVYLKLDDFTVKKLLEVDPKNYIAKEENQTK